MGKKLVGVTVDKVRAGMHVALSKGEPMALISQVFSSTWNGREGFLLVVEHSRLFQEKKFTERWEVFLDPDDIVYLEHSM